MSNGNFPLTPNSEDQSQGSWVLGQHYTLSHIPVLYEADESRQNGKNDYLKP